MPSSDPRVFPEARRVLDRVLAGLDARAPGLITGAHLTGSIALGDGRPGQSDIDLVLVRSGGFDTTATMAALEPALADLVREMPAPLLDAIVLDVTDLGAGPDVMAGDRPVIFENEVMLTGGGSARNPVTWATLRQCGIAWRGELDRDQLWHDPVTLNAWTRDNLATYWSPWLAQLDRLATRDDIAALIDEATEWGVLGVTRLHYTLATGVVTSKRGAGDYALDTFSQKWHPIVEEAIRIRDRRQGPSRFADPRDAVNAIRGYLAMVIDDALTLVP